jgi:hypothetical protein
MQSRGGSKYSAKPRVSAVKPVSDARKEHQKALGVMEEMQRVIHLRSLLPPK